MALSNILPLISVTHSHLESGRGVRGGMRTAYPENLGEEMEGHMLGLHLALTCWKDSAASCHVD